MLNQHVAMLNQTLLNLDTYASKKISQQARDNPNIIGMSFGEPFFGPPEYLLEAIVEKELTAHSLLDSLKRYESSKGSMHLREAISQWYKKRYNIDVDAEKEIMVTHGGVEAIILSILCVSGEKDHIAITDPSYMLYKRSIQALGRSPLSIYRSPSEFEYEFILDNNSEESRILQKAKALIINSPENPSGYVLSEKEWTIIHKYVERTGIWIIHDEVYDTMTFTRKHIPFKTNRSILINSFSKKFGIPGLRIGWMVADKEVISLANKIHDYLYLGINILSEKIATRIINDPRNADWLNSCSKMLNTRVSQAMSMLSLELGYSWERKPHGSMFLFPNVSGLYTKIPTDYKSKNLPIGDAVADYFIEEKKVAVVPGSVYGNCSGDYIRMVLCNTDEQFNQALNSLSK